VEQAHRVYQESQRTEAGIIFNLGAATVVAPTGGFMQLFVAVYSLHLDGSPMMVTVHDNLDGAQKAVHFCLQLDALEEEITWIPIHDDKMQDEIVHYVPKEKKWEDLVTIFVQTLNNNY